MTPVLTPLLQWTGLRWISAGTGCDSHLEPFGVGAQPSVNDNHDI
jgi:hypothetical protein